MKYVLTATGENVVINYIAELVAKRKEILDANKDTADDTVLPTIKDIEADINFFGVDEDGDYYNSWGVTDNYNADYPLTLTEGIDMICVNV